MKNTEIITASLHNDPPDAAILPRIEWQLADEDRQFQCWIAGTLVAIIERGVNVRTRKFMWWAWSTFNPIAGGAEDTLVACAGAISGQIGRSIELPPDTLAAYGEGQTVANSGDTPTPATDLADRLARMLAEVVDATIMTVQHPDDGREMALRLACFNPELADRAAELLEEVGY